jgi:hypothetical protein
MSEVPGVGGEGGEGDRMKEDEMVETMDDRHEAAALHERGVALARAAQRAQPQGIVRASGDVVEALQEYQRMQQGLDKAMPDSIMTISGKAFRKKAYWRAIATGFNLDVVCVKEELAKGDKDWGYLITCRATAPNGRHADGDGACFASEKNRGRMAATVHNVRSHAFTRAFNRAVSNLVGFGEVSAEEVGADGAQNDQDDPRPTQEEAPQGSPEPGEYDGPEPAGEVWRGVLKEVRERVTSQRTGKAGPYKLVGKDGMEFSTFDRGDFEIAKENLGQPMTIQFVTSTSGRFTNRTVNFIAPE